ncbi:hypothetical protein FQN54_006379 [Arachnomyces sp. PD_36]|nr:hypothetical protein FQN54_006379 [Arachnomyces sp. PD_36]
MSGSHHHRSHPTRDNRGEGTNSRGPPRDFSSSRPTLPPLPHMRFEGDGFDFRRPVMSTPTQPENVIDLTNDSSPPTTISRSQTGHSSDQHQARGSRGPRFGRNIMADVVDLREEPDTDVQSHGPGIMEDWPAYRRAGWGHANRSLADQTAETLVRGTGALAEMIVRLRHGGIPSHTIMGEDALHREVARRTHGVLGPIRTQTDETQWLGARPSQSVDLTLDIDNAGVLDLDLNYETPGMIFRRADGRRVTQPAPPPPAAYKAPSPAPAGFTRTTTDDDTLVCPCCQHELGVGDNPLKQQIWVSKPCGHVYCGECCKNRAASRGKRTDRPNTPGTKHFSRCVVPECGKTVSAPKSMFQIYL